MFCSGWRYPTGLTAPAGSCSHLRRPRCISSRTVHLSPTRYPCWRPQLLKVLWAQRSKSVLQLTSVSPRPASASDAIHAELCPNGPTSYGVLHWPAVMASEDRISAQKSSVCSRRLGRLLDQTSVQCTCPLTKFCASYPPRVRCSGSTSASLGAGSLFSAAYWCAGRIDTGRGSQYYFLDGLLLRMSISHYVDGVVIT